MFNQKNVNSEAVDEKTQESNTHSEKVFTGKHIKKKPLIAVAVVLVFLLLFNLFTPTSSKKKDKENSAPVTREKIHITDTVQDLPNSYGELKKSDSTSSKVEDSPVIPVDKNGNSQYVSNTQQNSSVSQEQQERIRRQKQEAEQAKRSNIGFKSFENREPTIITSSQQNSAGVDYDSNRQGSKKNFLKSEGSEPFYLSSGKSKAYSEYEVKAGNIIPGVLITGINSDLPGSIVAQVRENVFDSISGNYLLIPQGTRMIGTYDSNITWGQERVLIVWQRLLFPNGDSINLENMPGIDLSGYAGFTDKINNHFGTLLKGVLLSSMMGATSAVVTGSNSGDNSWGSEAGKGAGQTIVEIGDKFAQKALERQPTLEIRQGYRFNILVHRDMILTPYSN